MKSEKQGSKRLEAIGRYVPSNARLADIGSDHAYLPVELVKQRKIAFAVAGEVAEGPFTSAKNQVAKQQLEAWITVRLADGLDAIEAEDRITAITICGMGGVLIRDILEKGRQKGQLIGEELLILQPNVGEKALRQWLMTQQYTITAEAILEENGKIYEIIVAQKLDEQVQYTDRELFFGPKLLQTTSAIFHKKWLREYTQRQGVLQQLQQANTTQEEKIKQLQQESEQIKEVLSLATTRGNIHSEI